MLQTIPTTEDKFKTVINKNTFYFSNPEFEESYEAHVNSMKELLLVLKNDINTHGLSKELFVKLLEEKENGLKAILAITGISNETLKRLTTILRVVDNPELSSLVLKDKWFHDKDIENISEWGDSKINKLISENKYFRRGLVNLFFEGSTVPFLSQIFPLFELKKLSISKLGFEMPSLIDTIVRYKEKGSYSGSRENNAERIIEEVLSDFDIPFTSGDLQELVENADNIKRTMDFIIPCKENPLIIIESSFLATTSSGQGDKSKTEIQVRHLIKKHYPNAEFIGFVDGIGWYVRKGDLNRMVSAYDDVFTFHGDEINRFKNKLQKVFEKTNNDN